MSSNKQYSRNRQFFKSFFNPRAWVDYDRLIESGGIIGDRVKRLFSIRQPENHETFAEATQRFGLSDPEIFQKQQSLFRLSVLMLFIAAAILIYCVYQLYLFNWFISLVSLAFVGLALVLAFRYHFWYFQMKQRRLGCTLREWFNFVFRGSR